MSEQRLRTPEHEALRLIAIAAREEARLSQLALGKIIHRSRSYVSRIETGETQFDLVAFKRWMVGCGVNDVAYYSRWSRWDEPVPTDMGSKRVKSGSRKRQP